MYEYRLDLPLHLGLTQWWALSKYSNNEDGMSPGWRFTWYSLTVLAANSSNDGGCRDMSRTNRTTNGLSLKLS